jgi:hypothetical protein
MDRSRMSDPISRLEFARDEIDRVFGPGYAAAHPDVVSAVMISASLDWAATTIAAALVVEDEPAPRELVRPSLHLPR